MNKQNKLGRPTKKERAIYDTRNKEMVEMYEKGYPLDFMANYFNLSKGRIINIYKKYGTNTLNSECLNEKTK